MKNPFARRPTITAWAAALCLAGAASAQQAPDFSKVEIRTTQPAPNFCTLEGQGGTISVLTGPVDTHVHADHTGGNENFARLGAPLFSRDQLRERLAPPGLAADFDARVPQGPQTAERFVRGLYAEVAKAAPRG